ncbi:MAG TPA: DUF4082 domain-containing protein [Actinophytocola sp.]|uniref:DUF4082 domain-containing protein n=1 Tax=Actinophytocola sp. TaxID=1872138 RepID=UPI002DDCBF0F|nr:DUF4082 domain-containing protein [Actinophytocola sp.]HEV2781198.1 DUF4082 domain-containing protein [Actinophytocola sp.]
MTTSSVRPAWGELGADEQTPVVESGPYSIWSPSDTPAVPSAADNAPLELGVKFRADVTGSITGVRFYKGAGNGGTHTGSLWSADGTRLASAIFDNETATGWQTATFDTPVPIAANTTYVASYFAPQSHYSVTYNYFTVTRDNAPLHAPASIVGDPNGVFRYDALSGFPTSTHLSSNYWVDVVFVPGPGPQPPTPLDQGFGGPVLVLKSDSRPFSRYYSEILRAEGFNSFATADLSTVDAAGLSQYDVAVLGEIPLTTAQVTMLTDWVNAGGNLIAMRPDKKLAALLGLSDQGTILTNGYLQIATGAAPGAGLPSQTMQYHGTADRYTALSGTTTVAKLYSNATTTTNSPAVTLRGVGANGGNAVAFTYDLARSIVLTHQGNPAWIGDERDGQTPLRPADLFYGAKVGDVQPDWVDLTRVAIPQADEQQRLLSNIINFVNQDRKPIPKTWYLPKGHKAAVVMAVDDHGTETGTADYFDRLLANSPPGGAVETWDAARGTSWLWLDGPSLTDAQAAAYVAQGFDLGIHVNTGCANWTPVSLEATFHAELKAFADRYPSVPPQTGSRTHCIVWSDWASTPKVELSKGIRMDLNYYYAPSWWVQNRPGMFTGSGLPMRFADLDGTMIDVYQVASHLVNENGQTYPAGINTLLDRALGQEGYYGVFGAHFDLSDEFDSQVIASAKARGVPMISAKQILDWTDGRNNSYFSQIAWNGNNLTFTAQVDARTNGMLRGMLPMQSVKGALTGITRDLANVAFTQQTIKGVTYALFPVDNGSYSVAYTPHTYPASLWTPAAVPATITASDAASVELGVKFTPGVSGKITAVKFYKGPQNTGTHTVSVWSTGGTRLATATATNETASGWQTVPLAAPLNVTAGTTYVASYFAPVGRYSVNYDHFTNAYTSGPLTAPSSIGSGGNGVYLYGAGNAMPNLTYRSTNYWVDVVFTL